MAPQIAQEWGVELSSFGPVFSASLVGLMVGALLLGSAGDRYGRKPILLASFASVGLFTLLAAFSEGMYELAFWRFLAGIGIGGTMPNAIAIVTEYAPRRLRATSVTIMYCGFPLGGSFGGFIVAPLVTSYDWSIAFIIGGVLPLILSVIILLFLPESLRYIVSRTRNNKYVEKILMRMNVNYSPMSGDVYISEDKKSEGVLTLQLFSHGRAVGTVLLWVLFSLNLMMLYLMLNWLPTILVGAGLTLESAIIALSLFGFWGVIVGIALGKLIDNGVSNGIIAFTYFIAVCVAFVLAFEVFTGTGLLILVFVAGMGILAPQLVLNSLAANFYPTEMRGTGTGAALAAGRLGAVAGPLVGGLILSLGLSGSWIFLFLTVPALICAFVVYYLGLVQTKRNNIIN